MTPEVLAQCTQARIDRARTFAQPLTDAMTEFGIDTPAEQAAFLAQLGHESGNLRWTVELWDPTPAQAGYEGRVDLGNTQPGDGFKFRGRGLIQVTGRSNYARVGNALGVDLQALPERLAEPGLASRSAACFWHSHALNEWADTGTEADFERITRRINGGLNGLPNRLKLWAFAKTALGIST